MKLKIAVVVIWAAVGACHALDQTVARRIAEDNPLDVLELFGENPDDYEDAQHVDGDNDGTEGRIEEGNNPLNALELFGENPDDFEAALPEDGDNDGTEERIEEQDNPLDALELFGENPNDFEAALPEDGDNDGTEQRIEEQDNPLEALELFGENPDDFEAALQVDGDNNGTEEQETAESLIQEDLKDEFEEAEGVPTLAPSGRPSFVPSEIPTITSTDLEGPDEFPTLGPSASLVPSDVESLTPSQVPSTASLLADLDASAIPSLVPSDSDGPSEFPSLSPSLEVSQDTESSIGPSTVPSGAPSEGDAISGADEFPTLAPSASPAPSADSSDQPSLLPSLIPSDLPSLIPSVIDDLELLNEFPTLSPSQSPGPSLFPSLLPSALPSQDTAPAVIEEPDSNQETSEGSGLTEITCDLDASVQCETIDGEECSFSPISVSDMMCQEAPSTLMWLYKGGSCASGSPIPCNDVVEGGPNEANASFVSIKIHGEELDEIYFQDFFTSPQTGFLDSVVVLNREFTIPMEKIFVSIENESGLLQLLEIPNVCDQANGLIVGETYGALQFAGYQTETKSVQGFRHLEWSFAAQSESGLDLTVKKAKVVLGDEIKTIESGQSLGPNDEVTFTCRETISLPVGGSAMYSGAVSILAVGSNEEECAAAAASYINV